MLLVSILVAVGFVNLGARSICTIIISQDE